MQSSGIAMSVKTGTTYYNDIDPYCCHVLRKNIHLGFLPEGHVDERDIREVQATDLMGYQHIHLFAGIGGFPLGLKWAGFPSSVRLLTGGFPCQDISVAGKRVGITGERSGLWREMYHLICDIRPDFIIVENVAALLHRGIDSILRDLAACGYDAEWQVLSAAQFGAPHLRRRVFIVAYPNSTEWRAQSQRGDDFNGNDTRWQEASGRFTTLCTHGREKDVAYPRREYEFRRVFSGHGTTDTKWADNSTERRDNWQQSQMGTSFIRGLRTNWWRIEPDVGRMAPRVPARVDRLKGLGNAVVPQIVEYIARSIMASLEDRSEVAV